MKKVVLKTVKSITHTPTSLEDAEDIIKDLKSLSGLKRKTNRDLIKRDSEIFMLKYKGDEGYGDTSFKMDKLPSVLDDILQFCKKRMDSTNDVTYTITFVESGPRALISIPKPHLSSINRYVFNFLYSELYELEKDALSSESTKAFVKHLGFDPTARNDLFLPANSYVELQAGMFFDYTINIKSDYKKTYTNPSNPQKNIPFKRFPGYRMFIVVDLIDRTENTHNQSINVLNAVNTLSKDDIRNIMKDGEEAPITKGEQKEKERLVKDLMV
jgi:hypothetical protein